MVEERQVRSSIVPVIFSGSGRQSGGCPAPQFRIEGQMADWTDDELDRRGAEGATAELTNAELANAISPEEISAEEMTANVAQWWKALKEALKEAVARVRDQGINAEVVEEAEGHYRVSNHSVGLCLDIMLDAPDGIVRFSYASPSAKTIAPEGGMLTLRARTGGRIQTFYSDQHLDQEQLLETVLRPVLFPALPSEETAA